MVRNPHPKAAATADHQYTYLAMSKVISTTIYTQYETQTNCKTRFHSRGMILNGFQKNHISE